MYRPPATNATMVNPVTGQTIPVPIGSYNLFSDAAEDAMIEPLMRALDPDVQVSDGAAAGFLAATVTYGSDGRKITVFNGIDPVTGLAYVTTTGTLLQQRGDGSMWNNERHPPYTKLYLDGIAFSGPGGTGAPGAIQVDWGHD